MVVPSETEDGPSPGVGAVWASLAASLLTAAIAAPVLVSPAMRLFGLEAVGRHHDPFTFIEQLRRGGFSVPFFQPVTDGTGWLMARVLGPVVAFNVLVLASFPLSAAAAYLLARRAIASHAGALLAALLYAFSPFHIAHAAYHPHVAQTQWLPLYALALWRALEDATAARLALLAGASLLLGLSNFYSGLVGGGLTLGVLAAAAVAGRQDRRRLRSVWRTALVLACPLVTVVGAVAILAPEGLVRRYAFPASDAALFSARAWSYLLPPVYHPLFGRWSRGLWERAGLGESVLDDVRVAELEVSTDSRRFTIGPLSIRPRGSALVFRPREAPVIANSVLGNGDPREISIAVGAWRWRAVASDQAQPATPAPLAFDSSLRRRYDPPHPL